MTPPGINDAGPKLKVAYNSNAKDKLVGKGWDITGLPMIKRCSPNMAVDESIFRTSGQKNQFCLNGKQLIPAANTIPGAIAVYKTELDNFSRIALMDNLYGTPRYFELFTKDGEKLIFGGNDDEQQSRSYWKLPEVTRAWALSRYEDRYGNGYDVYYDRDMGEGSSTDGLRPSKIFYDPGTAVNFEYKPREGHIPWGSDEGKLFKDENILESITTYIDVSDVDFIQSGTPVRRYKFNYSVTSNTYRDILTSVEDCGFDNGSEQCARPLVFEYTEGQFGFQGGGGICGIENFTEPGDTGTNLLIDLVYDIDGDGYNDVLMLDTVFWGSSGGCFQEDNSNNIILDSYSGNITSFEGTIDSPSSKLYVFRASNNELISLQVSQDRLTKTYRLLLSSQHRDESCNGDPDNCGLVLTDVDRDGYTDVLSGNYTFIQDRQSPFMSLKQPIQRGGYGLAKGTSAFQADGDGFPDLIRAVPVYPDLHVPQPHDTQGDSYLWIGYSSKATNPINTEYHTSEYFKVNATTSFNFSALGHIFLRQGSGLYTGLDLNGDGYKDFMYHRKDWIENEQQYSAGYWRYRINKGSRNGVGPEVATNISSGQVNQYSHAYDYNKDGLEDLLAIGAAGCELHIYIAKNSSNGLSFEQANGNPTIANTGYDAAGCTEYASEIAARPFIGDFNNDGLIDYLTRTGVMYAKRGAPDLLNKIRDGFGNETTIQYSELTDEVTLVDASGSSYQHDLYASGSSNYPNYSAKRSRSVVAKVIKSDGIGGFNEVSYRYENLKFNLRGRGDLGFAKITAIDESKYVETTKEYMQDFPFTSLVKSKLVKKQSGNLIEIKDYDYAIHPQNENFVYLESVLMKDYRLLTGDANDPLVVIKTENEYDSLGTLVSARTTTGTSFLGVGAAASVSGVLSENYTLNEDIAHHTSGDWLLGFVGNTTITSTSGGETYSAVTERIQELIPNTGMLTNDVGEETVFPGTDLWKNTKTIRNNSGVIIGVEQSAAEALGEPSTTRTLEVKFSSGSDLYPTKELNSKGHEHHYIEFDRRIGAPTEVEDANGVTYKYQYDSLGRLIESETEDGTVTTTKYFSCELSEVECPQKAKFLTAVSVTNPYSPGTFGAPLALEFYDSFGRVVRTQYWAFDGTSVKVDVEYDSLGRVTRRSEPFAGNQATAWSSYQSFDALDRPSVIQNSEEGLQFITRSRDGDLYKTTVNTTIYTPTSGSSQTTIEWTDARGLTKKVLDAESNSVDYTYWPTGLLKSTIVNGNEDTRINIDYDIAGNKKFIHDPDAGIMNLKYNGFGEVRRQIWGEGSSAKFIDWEYDVLGREVLRRDTTAFGEQKTYSWVWDKDEPGLNKAFGYLSSKSGDNFREDYYYDSFSRPSEIKTTIAGLEARYFTYSYDDYSRLATVTYPNMFAIQNHYHANGENTKIRNLATGQILWAVSDRFDVRGNSTEFLFGNGVVSRLAVSDWSGRVSNITTGKLSDENAYPNFYGDIQALDFEYDTIGNLYSRASSRTDNLGNQLEDLHEHFQYDDLNRLKTSTVTGLLGGSRLEEFDYDNLGNLRSKTGVGILQYEQTGNAGVHAVTASPTKNYTYDAYGNVVQRGTTVIEYDVYNKPTQIGSQTFEYGPDHSRFKKTTGSSTTYYFNGGTYEETVLGSQVVKKCVVNGNIVFSEVNGVGEISYLHKDQLGSVSAVTDELGAVVYALSYDSWGARRKDNWELGAVQLVALENVTNRGFTGHEHLDESGLIHMNGRVYDPEVGRFLSADLYVGSPRDSQSFNRYTYVANNPLSRVDPNGYRDGTCKADSGSCSEVVVTGHRDPEAIAEMQRRRNAEWARFERRLIEERGYTNTNISYWSGKPISTDSTMHYGDELALAGVLILADIVVGGPTGEGIVPAVAILTARGALKQGSKQLALSLSRNHIKHMKKHLSEFTKLDPKFKLTNQIRLGRQIASNPKNYANTRYGSRAYDQMVDIGGRTVKVRAVVSESNYLKNVYIHTK